MTKKLLLETPYSILSEDLEVGMHIRIPKKYWMKHPFLRSKFVIKNENEIGILIRSGVNDVICDPTKSQIAPRKKSFGAARTVADITTTETDLNTQINDLWESKKDIQNHVEKRRASFRQSLDLHLKHIKTANELEKMILAKAPSETIQTFLSEEWSSIKEGIYSSEDDISISIVNNSSKALPYHHGTNTSVLSVLLGRHLGFSEDDLKNILLGAVLHDIGLNYLPQKIRSYRRNFKRVEYKARRQHLDEGVTVLNQIGIFNADVLKIVAQHHEHYNGMGYLKLKGTEISRLTRVVSICNFYDRQINNPVLTERMTPHQAISDMYKLFREQFDMKYLVAFVQMMGLYPAGSIVKLSDGSIGSIVKVHTDDIMNPEIILYDPEIDAREALFYRIKDLGKNIKIKKDVKPNSLPSSVRSYLSFSENLSYSLF